MNKTVFVLIDEGTSYPVSRQGSRKTIPGAISAKFNTVNTAFQKRTEMRTIVTLSPDDVLAILEASGLSVAVSKECSGGCCKRK